jgi:hypothetical protein
MSPYYAAFVLTQPDHPDDERDEARRLLSCGCDECRGIARVKSRSYTYEPSRHDPPSISITPVRHGSHYRVYGKPKASVKEVRERALRGAA